MEWLKSHILENARNDGWLRERLASLEYDDGFSFGDLLERGK